MKIYFHIALIAYLLQRYKITTPICKFFKKKIIKETPRDRDGSFESQTVKKRETIFAGMADQIISKLIYTTNAVEDYYRQVCKVTKNKGASRPILLSKSLCIWHTRTYVRSEL